MTANETLTQTLRKAITAGDLAVDGRLPPERELAEQFGVSRAKIRQALDTLEQAGTVYRRQGRGTFVTPPTLSSTGSLGRLAVEVTPQDIMEVRLEIEPALAAHAASRARVDDLARLEQFMLATLDLQERAAYEAADDIFHYQIALTAKNPLFLTFFDSIRTLRKLTTWDASRQNSHTPEMMARFGDQHRTLFEAIASGNAPEAARLMEAHLLDVTHAVQHSKTRSDSSRYAGFD